MHYCGLNLGRIFKKASSGEKCLRACLQLATHADSGQAPAYSSASPPCGACNTPGGQSGSEGAFPLSAQQGDVSAAVINLEVRNGEILLINGLAPALPPPLLAAGRARCEAEGLEGLSGTSVGPRAGVWPRTGVWPCRTPPAPAPPGGGCWQGMRLGRGEGPRLKIHSCIPWVFHQMFTQVFWWLIAQLNSLSIFFPYDVKSFMLVPADLVGIQPLRELHSSARFG